MQQWTSQASALRLPHAVMEDAIMNQPPAKKPSAPSVQHAKLAEVYGKLDPDLSPELALRWQRMVQYHAMLSKAALKRANRNRQPEGRASLGQLVLPGF